MLKRQIVLIFSIIWICPLPRDAATFMKYDNSRSYKGTSGFVMRYALFTPSKYADSTTKRWPLILTLHGTGGSGTDGIGELTDEENAKFWVEDSIQIKHPCFVFAPQCPGIPYDMSTSWIQMPWNVSTYTLSTTPSVHIQAVMKILDSLKKEFRIDTTKIYINGLSMGGFATWDILCRYPKVFAAAIPMSGAGDTSKAKTIASIPVWDFHGGADGDVPVQGSRLMMAAIEKAKGGSIVFTDYNWKTAVNTPMSARRIDSLVNAGASLMYTEYLTGGHTIWSLPSGAFYSTPSLATWLFKQSKSPTAITQKARSSTLPNSIRQETRAQRAICSIHGSQQVLIFNSSTALSQAYDLRGRVLQRQELDGAKTELHQGF